MLTYFVIGLWISSAFGSPIQAQNFKSAPLVYYSPSSPQYVQSNLYPFVQYPNESPAFGKALQRRTVKKMIKFAFTFPFIFCVVFSIQSQNDILFYPNQQLQQPIIVNAQSENVPITRFTAPPNGLVDAIYAWFAENNVPLPDDPSKNEATPDQLDSKDQEKTETIEKTAGEAEILAEADKNPNLHFPKKPISPKFNPGQKFYILNGQPPFFSNYQPVLPRFQPIIPQLLTRSAVPTEQQNILFLQPQSGIQQQNLKSQPKQEQANQNVVLVQDEIQADIKPVRYHNPELKAQNYVLLRENHQQENPAQPIQIQPIGPNYSRQQLLIGRLLPQSQEIKQQQTPIHQTHYVPVEVVPPQVPQFQNTHHQFYQNQDLPQQEIQQHPQLTFIHIPVDRNIQPPQYITTKTQPIPGLQQPTSGKQILYLAPETQRIESPENQIQQQTLLKQQTAANSDKLAPGIAALEFARYLASKQGNLYSDSVVIDAKNEEDRNEQDESEMVEMDVPQEPSIAQAQPGGIALAGPGGVAATAPRGTALVGDKGLAVSSPHATAVAGPNPNKQDKGKKL